MYIKILYYSNIKCKRSGHKAISKKMIICRPVNTGNISLPNHMHTWDPSKRSTMPRRGSHYISRPTV